MSTDRDLAVAVIMTTYNAAGTVVGSVRSALAQSYAGPMRVIVVDDGSSDDTLAALDTIGDSRLTVLRAGRVGRARALNAALDEAHGSDLVANLDADDYMLPDRLRAQVEEFRADPTLGVLGSAYYEIHQAPDGSAQTAFLVRPPTSSEVMRKQMAIGFPICHSCATFRRDVAVQLGGYDPRRRARIDFDLWLRIASSGLDVRNAEPTLGVHVKRAGTYFDGQFRVLRSAGQMARLNLLAAHRLDLGPQGYAKAAARFAYSLQRRSSVKATPRFSTLLAQVPDEVRDVTLAATRGEEAVGRDADAH